MTAPDIAATSPRVTDAAQRLEASAEEEIDDTRALEAFGSESTRDVARGQRV